MNSNPNYKPTYKPEPKAASGKIETVITCVNYADFLQQTLPLNLPHFDRVVIVTTEEDKKTQELCSRWSVECMITDAFTEKGDKFNKGHAINIGLANLRMTGWVIHMDADIVLPPQFRNMLDKSALNPDCIYGAQRCEVVGWEAWQEVRAKLHTDPQFSHSYMLSTPASVPVGATVIHRQYGYTPIGYFQLWHSSYACKRNLRYPDVQGNAEHGDLQWALKWPRANRILLPTVRVYHLQSHDSHFGANWQGRKTAPFKAGYQPK